MTLPYVVAILGWITTAIGWGVAYFLQISTLRNQMVIDDIKYLSLTIRECTEKYIEYSQCTPQNDYAQLTELNIIMLTDRIIAIIQRHKTKGRLRSIDIPLQKYYEVITGGDFGGADRSYISKDRLRMAFSDGELLVENAESSINR